MTGDLSPDVSPRLPLRPGDAGPAVTDLQQRLLRAGIAAGEDGVYDDATRVAVTAFQEQRRIRIDGVCGPQTWTAVVEAGWRLGDRLLFERHPMQRGDDVADLQQRLGSLGFLDDRVDGFLGPRTRRAMEDFQRNSGLTVDGICGPDTVAELERIASRTATTVKARVVERARLLTLDRTLSGLTVVIGDLGGVGALADAADRALHAAGATVVVTTGPDGSTHAQEANALDAGLFIGLTIAEAPRCDYYATDGFSSQGGERLATLLGDELADPTALAAPVPVAGMRLPVLRETRMPAVTCELGPARAVVERTPALAQAVQRAVAEWVVDPLPASVDSGS